MTEEKKIDTTAIENKAEETLDEFVKSINGQRRDPQVRLSRGIARHQQTGVPLFVEAPTGGGKSYSALAAAAADKAIEGKKTLISTHSHVLQDQLENDALNLAESSGEFVVAVLKGRSSYFCKLRGSQMASTYKDANGKGIKFDPDDEVLKVLDWAQESETGEKSDLDFPVSNETWNQLSVSSEQCAASNCPMYKVCFAEQAKARIKQADIGIVNHASVAQGMKQEKYLDGVFDNIVIDECHEFPAVVGEAMGATVTKNRLTWAGHQANKVASSQQKAQYEGAIERILYMGRGVREPLRHLNDHPVMVQLKIITSTLAAWVAALENAKGNKDYILKTSLYNLMGDVDKVIRGDTKTHTAWIEWSDDDHFTLRSNMFNPGVAIRSNLVDTYHSTTFMSATLKTGKTFNPFVNRVGMGKREWTGAQLPHIFDYEHNGLMWLPARMKSVDHPQYLSQVSMVAKASIKAAHGRTLILCTSWKGVNEIGNKLRNTFNKKEFPIIMQQPGVGIKPLSSQFRDNPHSVLIGTQSLWTGVSFEGDTCACVIMDKIPFPSPADPIIAARCEDAEENGLNAFSSVLVPEAATKMAQGAGRLIRTVNDRGVLVLPDPRLNHLSSFYKTYGSRLLNSLPPMSITYETQDALSFLQSFQAPS